MNGTIAFLLSRWVWTFVGTALLAALLWFFGPFLAVLEGWAVRLAIIVVMFALWGGVNWLLDHRRRRREAMLTAGITEVASDPAATASAEEAAALRDKLTTALALLKKSRGTKGYLYEQPWYAIIGPPGAGKTTALLNAGLRFPLAAELGQDAISGVGGTRLCEWWFTEDAVLIDTAGRYTTQDSDAAVDRAGWEAFLDLLKRTRMRQPLNGLIVAIALSDVAAAPRDERLAHARAIRRRIKEIQERLSIRLPVYAVFTKADLIAGFSEFFDDLDREKRGQVWGATFPLATGEAGPVSAFGGEFAALIEHLNSRLFQRLQAERSPDRRGFIAGFAPQLESLAAPLAEFLRETFGGSRLDPAPMLRGFYLTSATQEGTPIDRLTGLLARSFGLDQQSMPSLRPEHGRSYFLTRLVKDVIFGEAMLASETPGTGRRRLLIRAGSFALVTAVLLAGMALLWHERTVNQQQLDEMAEALAKYERTASGLPLDRVAEADLALVLPLLDEARDLPHGYDRAKTDASRAFGFGLSQDAKLASGARSVYRHAVERVLLPRLIWRLEAQMHESFNRPDFLYEAMRVYLMLGSAGPLDKNLVRAWEAADWQARYPGPVMAPMRAALERHLKALLADRLPAVELDGALIEAARATFSRVPLANRVYSRIVPSAAAQGVAPWRPADVLGPAGVRVFVRASGKPLSEGVPGLYTINGFYTVLLPALGSATKQVAGESWVLGTRSELAPDSAEARRLERDVIALYEADYSKHWDALMGDLNIVPMVAQQQAAQDLYILASPQSPMRDLLAGIARQLTLTKPPDAAVAAQAVAKAAAQQSAPNLPTALRPLTAAGGVIKAPEPPGKEIDNQYRTLRDYVGTGPGAPIDQTLKAMDSLRQQLARLAAASSTPGIAAAPPVGEDALQLLRSEAATAPQPVARWLTTLVKNTTNVLSGTTTDQIKKDYHAVNGPASLCAQAVTGRYPFAPGAANETPLDDFTKLFAPGGLLDAFFNTHLRPFVDDGGAVWKPRASDGVPAPISQADLTEFQRAAVIRNLFFGTGGNSLNVHLDLVPVTLDQGTKQVTLELGATTLKFDQGPPRANQITWPGTSGMGSARVVFDPAPTAAATPLQTTGAWALFRLFDLGNLHQAGAAERYQVTWRSGERQAVFEVRAGSVQNPFARSVLRDFKCPTL